MRSIPLVVPMVLYFVIVVLASGPPGALGKPQYATVERDNGVPTSGRLQEAFRWKQIKYDQLIDGEYTTQHVIDELGAPEE